MATYNLKNPAVKRIMQEIKEVQQDTSGDFMAEALENDIFEWHFAIRGPADTEFEGGIFHGRILLPAEYPFKPPAFMMLTPSGRFETGVKICLSISAHHPEHWQPSWSVRTALTALVAFMPSPGAGALGSLDYTKEERRKLAAKAFREPPKFGSAERQRLIDDMHQRMVAAMAAVAAAKAAAANSSGGTVSATTPAVAEGEAQGPRAHQGEEEQPEGPAMGGAAPEGQQQQQQQTAPLGPPHEHTHPEQPPEAPGARAAANTASPSPPRARATEGTAPVAQQGGASAALASAAPSPSQDAQQQQGTGPAAQAPAPGPAAGPSPHAPLSPWSAVGPTPAPASPAPAVSALAAAAAPLPLLRAPRARPAAALPHTPHAAMPAPAPPPPDTWLLTALAVALGVLIAAILLRKALVAAGYELPPLTGGSLEP